MWTLTPAHVARPRHGTGETSDPRIRGGSRGRVRGPIGPLPGKWVPSRGVPLSSPTSGAPRLPEPPHSRGPLFLPSGTRAHHAPGAAGPRNPVLLGPGAPEPAKPPGFSRAGAADHGTEPPKVSRTTVPQSGSKASGVTPIFAALPSVKDTQAPQYQREQVHLQDQHRRFAHLLRAPERYGSSGTAVRRKQVRRHNRDRRAAS